ncbi:PhoPQ-activated pathogenicity-related family protein [Chitinophaga sp. NPDC101104]|uniref:PhoPQ-activated pathogenicity-related family protein n=1 Tax=Chitinophaga sp. NPDC101104 TaxID=3390561 RepID=UPI003D049315
MRYSMLKTLNIFLVAVLAAGAARAQVTPETALRSYLNNDDKSFQWTVRDSFEVADITAYSVALTSQQWREHTWKHQLMVFVPKTVKHNGALLFITGGSLKDGEPRWTGANDKLYQAIGQIAHDRQAITAVLRQTPNQPLYNDLTEDALISYTLHNFKQSKDYTWPLLFPMVKSAVRAMDAVQELSRSRASKPVEKFVVAGASKRGWTTWLTGASDGRVKAIAPMVIDILNMPKSLDYQIETWKEYSIQIEDYVKLGIPQQTGTAEGKAITAMVDPYSYRKQLDMPKMLFMGTNDEYWVVDNVKNYINDIPGKYLLNYVPNAGHNMGDGKQVMNGLSAFFGITFNGQHYPECSYTVKKKGKEVTLNIKATSDKLEDVVVWTATSPDLDFRNDKWTSTSLGISATSNVSVSRPLPATGYQAFYVDLKYSQEKGDPYTVSTRVFLTDTEKVR